MTAHWSDKLERPRHDWDNAVDVTATKLWLAKQDTSRTGWLNGTQGKIYSVIHPWMNQFRKWGIHPRTALDLIARRMKPFDVPAKDVAWAIQKFYSRKFDEPPGTESKFGKQELAHDAEFKTIPGTTKIDNRLPINIKIACIRMGVELSYDKFADRYFIAGLDGHGPELTDAAVNRLRMACDESHEFLPSKELAFDTLYDMAHKNAFDPVCDYFDKVQDEWDHKRRIDRWLIDYAGAEDTAYVRAVGALILMAVVRRNREPGSKFDEMPVLESAQGLDKSSALTTMAIKPEWFSDSFPMNADNRQTLEHAQGKIIIEVAELQGMRKADVEHVKAMLSRQSDRGRKAYARTQSEAARRFVFVGTSNGNKYLMDDTGNRRFWPVKIEKFKLDKVTRDRDQLWGEAAFREALGESIRLDPSLWADAAKEQDKRMAIHGDPFKQTFAAYLGSKTGRIASEDAWLILNVDPGRRTAEMDRRFGAALRALGWKPMTIRIEGKPVQGYGHGSSTRRVEVQRTRFELNVEYEDANLTAADFES